MENALYLECREGSIMIRNGAGVYFIRKARIRLTYPRRK